ncbi:hypothetical protein [Limnohabitans sp.]|uniref:hypothetical protein n=1 Tax=Limnohabitans sp. TaxID=1907725 RepID=UPI0025C084E8|nr:hypothetical protein [Limnohabitans sp.]
MISQLFKRLFSVSLGTVVMSGCVLSELGEPPPWETDLWTKPGHTRSNIYSAIMKCRQQSTGNTSREKSESESLCMLRTGYKFIDWRAPHTFCKAGEKDPWAWNTPACRSLRGELIVTPDESATMPPQDLIDKPSTNTYTPPVPIAPSKHPAQVLQEQVQKDNNRHMNELLRGSDRQR